MQSRPAVAIDQPSEQAAWAERACRALRWNCALYTQQLRGTSRACSQRSHWRLMSAPGAAGAEFLVSPMHPSSRVCLHPQSPHEGGVAHRQRRRGGAHRGLWRRANAHPGSRDRIATNRSGGAAGLVDTHGCAPASVRVVRATRQRLWHPRSYRTKPASPGDHRGSSQPLGEHLPSMPVSSSLATSDRPAALGASWPGGGRYAPRVSRGAPKAPANHCSWKATGSSAPPLPPDQRQPRRALPEPERGKTEV